MITICKGCSQPIHHDTHRKRVYCSLECQAATRRAKSIALVESGQQVQNPGQIRRYLLEKFGNQCMRCEETHKLGEPIPVEMDHKDGNHTNNCLDNCWLLCPTCHAMTATYKNRNKGNGRHARRVRYAAGASY